MSLIYMMVKLECTGGLSVKCGYGSSLDRPLGYSTTNGTALLVATVRVYKKTRHQLETAIHKELTAQGYHRTINPMRGARTEWFYIPPEQATSFISQGFTQFRCCRRRKECRYIDTLEDIQRLTWQALGLSSE